MTSTDFTLDHASGHVDADGIATLRIDNAGALNILGTPVIDSLREGLARLRDDARVRVLVLRGSGDRAFVAGADIAEMATLDETSGQRFIGNLRALCEDVRRFPTPVIARIPQWCLGGGLELALACDIRIASDNAQFGMPEVKVGIPSVIHAALLPPLIGAARSAWLLLTGDLIDAEKAVDWGVVHELAPLAGLDAAVQSRAHAFTQLGPVVLRQQKALLRHWEAVPLDQAIADSVPEFGKAFGTGEPQRYMNEFLDRKRQAKARG